MKSANKTKKELITELESLQVRISELENQRTSRSDAKMAYIHKPIFVVFDRKFEFINDRFAELFGVKPEEACSLNFNPMTIIAPESRCFIRELYQAGCRGSFATKVFNFTGLSKDGIKIECEVFCLFIPYKWGIAIQGILNSVAVSRRFDEALQRGRHYVLPAASKRRCNEFPVNIKRSPVYTRTNATETIP